MGLIDDRSEEDAGCQGYLQMTAVVLGPGDRQHVHSESEEGGDAGAGGDDFVASMVMMPPSIKQELHFLVVTIHKVSLPQVLLITFMPCCSPTLASSFATFLPWMTTC